MATACGVLHHEMDHRLWTGFHLVTGDRGLRPGPYQGPPVPSWPPEDHTTCLRCARTGEPVVVPDVEQSPAQAACHPAARSEIALPLMKGRQVAAVLTILSTEPCHFDRGDVAPLQKVLELLEPHLPEQRPGASGKRLTVADVLDMPVFAQAQVVAGRDGLDRRLQWVHLIDIPEMADWAEQGELLFTTAFGLRDRPDLQSTLIPSLVERDVAGMVVGIGRYFQDIPEVMIAAADRLDFPIITLPWSVPFIEVGRAISERIISEQYALLQQSAHIHETLTRVVLKGADLEELAEVLVELVECSLTIEDSQFHLLASATAGEIDQAREESLLQSRTPPALLAELERQGILKDLRDRIRPVPVPPVPEQGLTLERIVAPIVAGGTTHGYVWLIVEDRPISDLDMIAIEHAATVAALILLKEKAVYETEQRLKSSLLDNILERPADLKAVLPKKARRFGYDLAQSQQALIIRRQEETSLSSLSHWVRQKAVQGWLPGLVVERGENLVLLLQSSQAEEGLHVAQELWEEGKEEGYLFRVGVGRVYADWERLSDSYEEAREALRIGPALLGKEVVSYAALGFLPWLRHLPAEAHESNAFTQAIQSLVEHDQERGEKLLETLETYLDAGGNIQEAARRLFLHRNTVRQRLNQIESRCDIDLDDALTRLNLHIALKERRLRHQG